jgi:hypothetical protein
MYPKEHYNGLSLVIAHNQKAEALLKDMEAYLQTMPCDEERAAKVNFRLVDGYSPKQYLLERKLLDVLFSNCSYKTLKKIYANDYKNYSPWVIWKAIRKIWTILLSEIVK